MSIINNTSTIHTISYDPDVDAMHIRLVDQKTHDSDIITPSLIVDYDQYDNVIGLEILDVKKNRTLVDTILFNSPILSTWHMYSPNTFLNQLRQEVCI